MADSTLVQILIVPLLLGIVLWYVKRTMDDAKAAAEKAKETAEKGLQEIRAASDRNAIDARHHMDIVMADLKGTLADKEREQLMRENATEQYLRDLPKLFPTRTEMDITIRAITEQMNGMRSEVQETRQAAKEARDATIRLVALIGNSKQAER